MTDTLGAQAAPLVEPPPRSMDEYRAHIQQLANESDGLGVGFNRTRAHASVVFSIVFAKAQNLVEVISEALDDDVWGQAEVTDAAVAFLRRNQTAKLRIVSEKPVDVNGNAFLCALRAAGLLDQVKLFSVPPAVLQDYGYHFIVADAQHYRFQSERSKFEATIQFGNADLGRKLQVIFGDIRAKCGNEVAL